MRAKSRVKTTNAAERWLLLVHQLPPKPAYLRVKIWRRLQDLGAIAVKNSVYVLPANEQGLENFQWLLKEIEKSGGVGMLCEAELVDGLRDDEVRALFDAARDNDYAELSKELRALKSRRKTKSDPAAQEVQFEKLRQRFETIVERDFFGASGKLTAAALLNELERRRRSAVVASKQDKNGSLGELENRTWVTRKDVHVDRIACAWLIRRFIDRDATFKFVEEKSHRPKPGELRFDMFEGEFTHEGDKCTFEVLAGRLDGKDAGLRAIAEIVHDIDLKDDKFGREETSGIAHVIAGVCSAHADDMARITRGGAVFDDVYERFRKRRR